MDMHSDDEVTPAGTRWSFLRDVLVFQLKLVLGNLLNFVLLPVSVIAAVYDFVFRPRARHGENFYRVLEAGRKVDEAINAYGAIGGYHATGSSAEAETAAVEGWRGATVDGVVRRVEDALRREVGKGGTAASIKAAVDRALDDLQRDKHG